MVEWIGKHRTSSVECNYVDITHAPRSLLAMEAMEAMNPPHATKAKRRRCALCLHNHRHSDLGALVAHIAHRAIDRMPGERFGARRHRTQQLFGLIKGKRWVQPQRRVGRAQHSRAAIMHIDQPPARWRSRWQNRSPDWRCRSNHGLTPCSAHCAAPFSPVHSCQSLAGDRPAPFEQTAPVTVGDFFKPGVDGNRNFSRGIGPG